MANILNLKTNGDTRGKLTVIEKILPFDIKRVFYIYDTPENAVRGGHRHVKNRQALICLNGSCVISVNDGKDKCDYLLDSPDKCLILNPEDWHTMHDFTKGSILLVMASEYYCPEDYISQKY